MCVFFNVSRIKRSFTPITKIDFALYTVYRRMANNSHQYNHHHHGESSGKFVALQRNCRFHFPAEQVLLENSYFIYLRKAAVATAVAIH